MNGTDLLRLDAQLCFLLYATTRAVTQAYAPLLAPLGLTYPQYLVMLVLWEEDGVGGSTTLGHIGARLRLDSGTLTPLIKRMESAGLVVRARRRDDERVLTVGLTEAGRGLRAKAEGVPVQMFCQAGLTASTFDRLASDLRRVLEALQGPRADTPTAITASRPIDDDDDDDNGKEPTT